ncbi:Cof-type HAD-IIB family hydrolase [Herbiconiux moechotypicola]|uniref:HAD family hydrolase n=1 Tax=Herbiconiux moechotypicola TaxID=637393 RepID=A0ABN3DD22_9MICO|nr:HAD family hydrolase [Herbiconiux moechotypicola]MCS5728697.1 Cof-type HAD-IIB family hydrolase [Herbiconiux moechotypicola]
MSVEAPGWLVALDIDGTVLHEDGTLSDIVGAEVRRVVADGNEVMLATGRSVGSTLPVLDRLGITPRYVVCANGAVTLIRDPEAPLGYRSFHIETFDPGPVLTRIRSHLTEALFAVEDSNGQFLHTEAFPETVLGEGNTLVSFDELQQVEATRVVVISPGHDMEDFLAVVERMGLHRVSYSIGWTAWLDIAPDGVNKATGLERVRDILGVPRSRVMAVGDGRNDIDMFRWAGAQGRAVAMAQSPDDVLAVATEVTASIDDDGVAQVLATL